MGGASGYYLATSLSKNFMFITVNLKRTKSSQMLHPWKIYLILPRFEIASGNSTQLFFKWPSPEIDRNSMK